MQQYGDVETLPQSKRICRKCLTGELPEAEFFQNMYSYTANLDEEVKAPAKLYEKRLSLCRECSHLLNGMCRLCGCFVEMRAAVSQKHCPDIEQKW